MPNALFNALGGNNMSNLVQQIKQFQQTFKGDPKAEVERLVRTGQMSQDDFNRYAQTANQLMQMFK
ncbi:MAG: hypothetical protein U0L88_04905 [Acutalibacteraceae bacterium]|nr:hypothetical protein [Acutalibacteraceae bacterium]